VTVTHLPVTRCQICHRTAADRPGNLSEVLTGHYRRTHPETLGPRSRKPAAETLSAAESHFRAGQGAGMRKLRERAGCKRRARLVPPAASRWMPACASVGTPWACPAPRGQRGECGHAV